MTWQGKIEEAKKKRQTMRKVVLYIKNMKLHTCFNPWMLYCRNNRIHRVVPPARPPPPNGFAGYAKPCRGSSQKPVHPRRLTACAPRRQNEDSKSLGQLLRELDEKQKTLRRRQARRPPGRGGVSTEPGGRPRRS